MAYWPPGGLQRFMSVVGVVGRGERRAFRRAEAQPCPRPLRQEAEKTGAVVDGAPSLHNAFLCEARMALHKNHYVKPGDLPGGLGELPRPCCLRLTAPPGKGADCLARQRRAGVSIGPA